MSLSISAYTDWWVPLQMRESCPKGRYSPAKTTCQAAEILSRVLVILSLVSSMNRSTISGRSSNAVLKGHPVRE
jgi:hypothetical protein